MRILFVSAAFLPDAIGGVELHVHGIAKILGRVHDVRVFCRGADPSRPEFDVERYQVDSVEVVRINYLWSDAVGFPSIYRNQTIRERFLAECREFRPDVVHAHHLTCLSTDLLDAAKETGAATVMTLHDFWMGCPRGQRMTPSLELCADIDRGRCVNCLTAMWSGWFGIGRDGPSVDAAESRRRDLDMLADYDAWIGGVLDRVDLLVTPSASSRQLFERQGVAPGRIRVVENGIDHAPFQGRHRDDATPRTGGFRFGFIGSVLPTKGVHLLIEALAHTGRDDCRVDVHGVASPWHEITDYGDRLRELAAPLGDRVTFHGRYEPQDLPGILAGLDALVIPSLWYEAFCLTLREGYLAGLPMIVSDLGAMAEGVEDEVTALLFRAGDARDLATQMTRVMDDAALRDRLRRSAKRVRTVEDNAAELLQCYREVAGMVNR